MLDTGDTGYGGIQNAFRGGGSFVGQAPVAILVMRVCARNHGTLRTKVSISACLSSIQHFLLRWRVV